MTRRVVAVVLAGGLGTRVGSDRPKQLLRLGGTTILGHAIAAFERSPLVDEVLVVMAPGHLDAAHEVVREHGFATVRDVVEGGATRTASTLAALAVLGDEDVDVLVHDAARPLLPEHVVTACVEALRDHEAVEPVLPLVDTVVTVDHDVVAGLHEREALRRVQTPQGFRLATLRRAYALATADPGFTATDDASVVVRYLPGVPVAVVPGDERNLKVTGPLDVVVAEHLLARDAHEFGTRDVSR
jgi:2-C-methyl-D-erythritol 4-phosphate cytidylyltransferase